MRHSRTAEEIGDRNITRAAHPPTAGVALHIPVLDVPRIPFTRDMPLPEPVDTEWVNGRAPLEWEVPLIRAARERERRLELGLLAGIGGE